MSPEAIATVLVGLFASGASVYATVASVRASRKTRAIEQHQTALGGYRDLVSDLRKEVDRLRTRVDDLEKAQRDDHNYIRSLVTTIRDGGLTVPVRASGSNGDRP